MTARTWYQVRLLDRLLEAHCHSLRAARAIAARVRGAQVERVTSAGHWEVVL